jgi:hypothetical protein
MAARARSLPVPSASSSRRPATLSRRRWCRRACANCCPRPASGHGRRCRSRGSVLGDFVGIVPGWAHRKLPRLRRREARSRTPEAFGHGAVAGVGRRPTFRLRPGPSFPCWRSAPTGPVAVVLMAAADPRHTAGAAARSRASGRVLRISYAYLYPLIIMLCSIGVYEEERHRRGAKPARTRDDVAL